MKSLKIWLGILITALFLYLILRKANLTQVGNSLKEAQYHYLIPSVLAIIISFYFRAIRWVYLLEPLKKISVKSTFPTIMISFMVNDILPARAGEFVRAYLIGKKENISKSASFATIVIERLFDIATLLLLMITLIAFFSFPPWIKKSGFILIIFFFFCLAILFFINTYFSLYERLFHKLFFFISFQKREKILIRIKHFTLGLAVFKSPKLLILIFLYSLIVWFLISASVYFGLLIFNLNLPFYTSFFVTVVIAISLMLPSAPGFIGTFQFACVSSLALFQVNKDTALSFSIILHAIQFLPIIFIGYFFMIKENLSFSSFRRVDKNDNQ
ncbi:flippase-like domain-containing protein [bacterium]|nr:flippase-like domain-containing protein [bacterium]MBU1153963.1 flippase-like domain-containing protein [bacterium]MBU1782012.1 flippase-like domain-containing protein [bacterium]